MLSSDLKSVATRAKAVYNEKIRPSLENTHHGKFVCIEPDSGDFFLGNTFDDAVNQAIDAYPDRLTHTLRIGHAAALHLGVMLS
jgi:hypothetical protein